MARTEKIRSDTGASFALALLLFLVCTVAGTVVLTAATAAAGRLSELSEMDQRYYSVASAARLLAQELDGKSVTIVRSSDSVTVNQDGENIQLPTVYWTLIPKAPATLALSSDSTANGQIIPTNGISFLTGRAIYLLFGETLRCCTEDAMNYSFNSSPYTSSDRFTDSGNFILQHSSSDIGSSDADALRVVGTFQMKQDGALYIIVNNSSDTGSADTYSLTLALQPVFQETKSSGYKSSDDVARREFIETKTSTVTWKVRSIG